MRLMMGGSRPECTLHPAPETDQVVERVKQSLTH